MPMRRCCALPHFHPRISAHFFALLLLAAPSAGRTTALPVYTSLVPRHCTAKLPRRPPSPTAPSLTTPARSPCTLADAVPRLPGPPPEPRLLPIARDRASTAACVSRPHASCDRPLRLSAVAGLTPSTTPRAPKIPQPVHCLRRPQLDSRRAQHRASQSYSEPLAPQEPSLPAPHHLFVSLPGTRQGTISRHGPAKRPRCSGHEKVCQSGAFSISFIKVPHGVLEIDGAMPPLASLSSLVIPAHRHSTSPVTFAAPYLTPFPLPGVENCAS